MEERVFFLPAVAGEIENFVEARLHCDAGPRMREFMALQMELTNNKAQPGYVTVDPIDQVSLGIYLGATLSDETPFVDFLKDALEKRPRKTSTLNTAGEQVAEKD
jgi:hypothetical protein